METHLLFTVIAYEEIVNLSRAVEERRVDVIFHIKGI